MFGPKKPPGVTPMDVRLAIFVEGIYTAKYAGEGDVEGEREGAMPGSPAEFEKL